MSSNQRIDQEPRTHLTRSIVRFDESLDARAPVLYAIWHIESCRFWDADGWYTEAKFYNNAQFVPGAMADALNNVREDSSVSSSVWLIRLTGSLSRPDEDGQMYVILESDGLAYWVAMAGESDQRFTTKQRLAPY